MLASANAQDGSISSTIEGRTLFWDLLIQVPTLLRQQITFSLILINLLAVSIRMDDLDLHYRIRLKKGLSDVEDGSLQTAEFGHFFPLQNKIQQDRYNVDSLFMTSR